MKKFLWVFGGFFLLCIFTILLTPSFINWNDYKTEITKNIKELTGQTLIIDGDIDISIIPSPAIVASEIRLLNPKAKNSEPLAYVKSVEIEIAIAPIIVGELKVETIRLVRPKINLEIMEDKKTNWSFEFEEQKNSTSNLAGPSSLPETDENNPTIRKITLDDFTIVNGTIVYRNTGKGIEERFNSINARIIAASQNGPFKIVGDSRIRGINAKYNIKIGEVIKNKTLSFILNSSFGPGDTSFQLSGTILNLFDEPQFLGTIKGESNRLVQFFETLRPVAFSNLLSRPVAFEGNIKSSIKEMEIENLRVNLGNSLFSGDFTLDFEKELNFSANLAARHFDISHFKKMSKLPSTPKDIRKENKNDTAKSNQSKLTKSSPSLFRIPKNIKGSIILSIDTISYKNGLVRDLTFNALLDRQALNLKQFSFQFPGGSDFNGQGIILNLNSQPAFTGEIALTSNNFLGALNWAGTNLKYIPNYKFRKLDLKSKLKLQANQAQLTDINLRLDSSRINGAITFALTERLSFGINAFVDRINIDTYLKNSKKSNNLEQALKSVPPSKNGLSKREPGISRSKGIEKLAFLNSFDANVSLKIKKLTYKENNFQNINFNSTLHAGNLRIHKFLIKNFEKSSFEISGDIRDLTRLPEASGIKIKYKTKSLQPLTRVFKLKMPVSPKRFGVVEIAGQIDGSLLSPKIKAKIIAAKALINAQGSLSLLPIGNLFDLSIRFRHKDIFRLARNFGSAYRPSVNIGKIDSKFRISGTMENLEFSKIKTKIGNVDIKGTASINMKKSTPQISGNFDVGSILIDDFIPLKQRASLSEPQWPQLKRKTVQWGLPDLNLNSTKPLPNRVLKSNSYKAPEATLLHAVNASIKIKVSKILYKRFLFRNIKVLANTMAGNLEFKSINGNLFGGQIKGVAVMTSGQENQLSSKFNLTNILLSEAFLATFGKNLAEGKLDVDLDLTNSNITSTRFMSLFQGAAQLQIKKLKIAAKNKNPIFQGLHLLSTFVNPSTKKVKELTSNITGSFNIKQGIAQTQDLILISDLGVAPVYGHINLPLWQIDMAGTLKPEKTKLSKLLKNSMQKKELSIPFTFKGSLNSPLFKFDPSSLLRAKVTKNVLGNFVGKNQKTVGRLLEGFLKGSNPADRNTDRNFNDKSITLDPSKLLKNFLK